MKAKFSQLLDDQVRKALDLRQAKKALLEKKKPS